MSDCSTEDFQGRLKSLEGRAQRLFGSIADPATEAGYLPLVRSVSRWQPHNQCGCGVWMIQSSVAEILRSAEEGDGLLPLPLTDFGENQALPAGAVRVFNRSQVKLRISAEVSTIHRQWLQDVGQSIEVNADCVCVEYVVPDNFYEIPGAAPTPATRLGLVADVWLSVALTRLEQTVGDTEATFTTNLYVPAGEQLSVAIPPFARKVTIYQNTLGAASGLWTQWYGDPNVLNAVQAGVLPWIAGARRTESESVLPDITHFLSDLDDSDRFYTLRWTIRP